MLLIPYEENFLEQKFGNGYKEYVEQTGRITPRMKPYRGSVQVLPHYRADILGEIYAPVVLAVLFAVIYLLFVR